MASTDKIEAFLAEPRNVVIAGTRRDGSPHLSPNWFYWDGQRFYISTTRHRAKYAIFRRDSRAELLVDDCTGYRALLVRGTVESEDMPPSCPASARSATNAMAVLGDRHLRALTAEGRVLLAITPGGPSSWSAGLD
jgi:PPOX class probable F420-dependent enzyme